MATEKITLPQLPRRAREAHKGDFGRVYILAGSVGLTGAPVLAAAGALKAGAGLVHVGVSQSIYPIVAGKLLCAMAEPLKEEQGASAEENGDRLLARCGRMDAVLLGPGMGAEESARRLMRRLTGELETPLVLDADGINALAEHMDVLDRRKGRCTILTPHEGEFCRLLGRSMERSREEEARRFATEHGCTLVLKGQGTLVALEDGRVLENPTGNPGMASGGSGDVLAGMILGFVGQGFSVEEACKAGVYLHGLAGDLAAEELGEYAMTAGDLLRWLPQAMKRAEGREG